MSVYTNLFVDLSAATNGTGTAASPYNNLSSIGTGSDIRAWIRRTGVTTTVTLSTLALGSNVELLAWPKVGEYAYTDRDTSLTTWDADTANYWHLTTSSAEVFTFTGRFYISGLHCTSTATGTAVPLLLFTTDSSLVNFYLKGSVDAPLEAPTITGNAVRLSNGHIEHQRTDGGIKLIGSIANLAISDLTQSAPADHRELFVASAGNSCVASYLGLQLNDLGSTKTASLSLNSFYPNDTIVNYLGLGNHSLSVTGGVTTASLYLNQPQAISMGANISAAHLDTQHLTLTTGEFKQISARSNSSQTHSLVPLSSTAQLSLGEIATVPLSSGETLGYEAAVLRIRQADMTARVVTVTCNNLPCIQIEGNSPLTTLGTDYALFTGTLQPYHTQVELCGACELAAGESPPQLTLTVEAWDATGLLTSTVSEVEIDSTSYWVGDTGLHKFKLVAPLQPSSIVKASARVSLSSLPAAYLYLCTVLQGG